MAYIPEFTVSRAMATLRNDELSLEIRYRSFEDSWVYYDIWFRWRDEPIINDALLKRSSKHWAKRAPGAIIAEEHRECGILPLLSHVLKTNEAEYWEPMEPDVLLAIYPRNSFPFLPSKWKLAYESQEFKARREARDVERAKGPLPDDLLEVMLFVDMYNFEGCGAYSGTGFCFRLAPTRAALQDFYEALKSEYLAFREKWNIQQENEAAWGPGYAPPDY